MADALTRNRGFDMVLHVVYQPAIRIWRITQSWGLQVGLSDYTTWSNPYRVSPWLNVSYLTMTISIASLKRVGVYDHGRIELTAKTNYLC